MPVGPLAASHYYLLISLLPLQRHAPLVLGREKMCGGDMVGEQEHDAFVGSPDAHADASMRGLGGQDECSRTCREGRCRSRRHEYRGMGVSLGVCPRSLVVGLPH